MSMMSYDYIRKAPPFARAKTTSKKLEGLKAKLERWGSNSNLEREIALCEDLLDGYLIKAGDEALESLKALQGTLDEYKYRKAEGYLTSEQIARADGIKSHLGALLSNR